MLILLCALLLFVLVLFLVLVLGLISTSCHIQAIISLFSAVSTTRIRITPLLNTHALYIHKVKLNINVITNLYIDDIICFLCAFRAIFCF